jgi:hypothetical protein
MVTTLLWFVSAMSLALALVAWRHARRMAKRLDQLTQMYWELKYQYGELRVRLQHGPGPTRPADGVPPESAAGGGAFIPLTSLKR